MTSINTTTWREFCVGDLFDIRPTKNYRLNNSELFASEGNTRVVVNSSQNNGIGGYVGLEPTEPGNVVTFSDTTDANGIFIQDEPFVGYSHVQGMHCKDSSVSFEALQFFATAFKAKAMTMGFNYQNKFRRDAASKIIVKLPATPDGKPDWDYMEQYMKSVMENTKARLQRNQKIANAAKHGIDISNWKEFRIEDLFELERGKESAPKRNPDGDVWLVSETRENNGYTRKVKPKAIIQGNCITVSVNYAETVFYQPSDFCASVNILILRNDFIDEFSGQFIASVLSVNNRKYTYENKISAELLMKTCLKLPATPDGKPDWTYMKSYMRERMESRKRVLNKTKTGA